METVVLPLAALMKIIKSERKEARAALRRPKAANMALPPSSRPIGKRDIAEKNRPLMPARNKGWTGTG
jgi:hypothetical protein